MIIRFLCCLSIIVCFFPTFIRGINTAIADEKVTTAKEKAWYDDWNKGMAAAKKEKKPILVDFFSDHCGACKAMHTITFTAPEIKKRLSADWINIRINTSHIKSVTHEGKTMNYLELAKYFRVNGVPTYIFFDKEGKPVQSLFGYRDKKLFGPILDYMKDEAYKKGITFKEYSKSKEN